MYGFAQVPCPKCGTTVHVAPQVGTGVCPKCYTQTGMQPGAAAGTPQPQPFGAPGAAPPGAPQAGGPQMGPPVVANYGGRPPARSMAAGVAVAVLAVAGSGGYYAFKSKFMAAPGKATYSSLGIDSDKADGDKMMTSVSGLAKKWKSDAIWWSVNYQAVHADGTVDVSKGAEVEYISPNKVTSASKKLRQDGIKKFVFGASQVDYSAQWDATNQWTVDKPEAPSCTIKDVAKKLKDKGLTGSKTVRISFDPQFDWGQEQTWHVTGEDPKIDARFSMTNCEEIGKIDAGSHSSGEDE